MSQEYNVRPGAIATDREDADGDEMVIIDISDAPCDDEEEAFVRWDYNMNAWTVADENEEYGYDPKQPFAIVAFVPNIERSWADWKRRDLDFLRRMVENDNLKTYKYPVKRLRASEQQF